MLHCPHCRVPLLREKTEFGMYWRCSKCEGRIATLPVLRKSLDKNYLKHLWKGTLETPETGVECPFCLNRTREVTDRHGAIKLDICRRCEAIWFDTSEFEGAPSASPPPEEKELPERAKEILAEAKIRQIREKAEAEEPTGSPPDDFWKAILTVFGFPVEEVSPYLKNLPWITWIVGALMVLTTVTTELYKHGWVDQFGLIATQPGRFWGLTFLTSFFLHAGWLHLIGNLYFLLVFGDDVENFLGKWRYLLLLLGSDLIADCGQIFFQPESSIPLVGASGGIAGILGFYALRFPGAKIYLMIGYQFYLRWVKVPAVYLFIFWIFLQMWTAYEQKLGITNIAGAAHLGGAIFGAAIALAGRLTSNSFLRGILQPADRI